MTTPVAVERLPDHGHPAPSRGTRRGGLVRAGGFLASLAILVLALLLSLRIGSASLSTREVIESFTAYDGSNAHLIVRTLRLPRTIIALGVGVSLALAGVTLQAVTRNALASPTVLGVNAGASFAIAGSVYLLDVVTPTHYVWFAFAGAFLAMMVVFAIASAGRSGPTPVRVALAGAVMTALLTAWLNGILVFNQRTLDEVRFWLAGSVSGRELSVFWQVAPFMVVGVVLVVGLIRQFDTMALGEGVAAGLGQRTAAVRTVAMIAVVLLAGSAVAAAGPILFVGLAVPHAVRSVVGSRHRWLVPYAAVYGAVLLLVSDVIGRIVARPGEIQVGVITAIVGAPVLIHLVRRRRMGEL